MGITATLAKLSAIYQTLSKVDNKTYGFKNGEFFEVVAAADDGVTKANFIAKFRSYDIVHRLVPRYLKAGVGLGIFDTAGATVGTSLISQGTPFTAVGSTSAAGATYGPNSVSAGTTTTGGARRQWQLPMYNEAAGNRYNKYAYAEQINLSTNPNRKMLFTATHYVSALSNATDAYTALISLGGPGPSGTLPILATHYGIHLTYTHSANSGNYVMQYRNTGGTLTTVNTSVPASTSAAPVYIVVTQDRETGSLTVELSVGLAAPTVYTITDYADGNVYPLAGYIATSILKSAGTTNRTSILSDIAIGMTFA